MRYEIVGAQINGTILLTLCFIMALEGIQRIAFFPEEIENIDYVLIVGGSGLIINFTVITAFVYLVITAIMVTIMDPIMHRNRIHIIIPVHIINPNKLIRLKV